MIDWTAVLWTVVNVAGLGASAYVWQGARADLRAAHQRGMDPPTLLYLRGVLRSQSFRVGLLVVFTVVGVAAVATSDPRPAVVRSSIRAGLILGAVSVAVDSICAGLDKRRLIATLRDPRPD